jgi:hypothetical protein
MAPRLSPLLLLLVPAAVLAGAYDQPWSMVEPGDRSEVRKEFPAAITQIDGQSVRDTRRPDAVAPGKHAITIRYETGRMNQSEAEATRVVDMELAPCTRYRIVAKRDSGTKWNPQVYPEPISECTRKFQKPAS